MTEEQRLDFLERTMKEIKTVLDAEEMEMSVNRALLWNMQQMLRLYDCIRELGLVELKRKQMEAQS